MTQNHLLKHESEITIKTSEESQGQRYCESRILNFRVLSVSIMEKYAL